MRYGCFSNLHISQLRDMALARMVGASYTKANSLIATCEDLGILRQIGAGKRNRKFIYHDYVGILSEGTDLSTDGAE